MALQWSDKVENLIDAVRELLANMSDAGQDTDAPDIQAVKDALKQVE